MATLVYTRLQDHPRETYFATSGALIVGRVDCICADPPPSEQWVWGMQLDIGAAPFRRGAAVGSRDQAMAELGRAWDEWKLWAGLCDVEVRQTIDPIVAESIREALI